MTMEEIRAKVRNFEEGLLYDALEAGGWNQSRTARSLGCGYTTLRRMIERHPKVLGLLGSRGPLMGRPPAPAD
ncbi:MAG: helix-turn-helix domain-containing protein [Verrucomicrobiota bacterium]